MREKFLTGFSPQKIRDSYIISLEAKMASFAAGLRELEALNEERVLKSIFFLVENHWINFLL